MGNKRLSPARGEAHTEDFGRSLIEAPIGDELAACLGVR